MARSRAVAQVEPAAPRELSQEQENVIAQLLTGATDAECAERCGVGARSIVRWRGSDALFVAELNRRRQELWVAQVDKVRSMLRDAVGVLADDLRADDDEVRRAAARAVLRLFWRDMAPGGPTDEREVAAGWRHSDIILGMY